MANSKSPAQIAATAVQVGTVTPTAQAAVSKAAEVAAAAGTDMGMEAGGLKTNRVMLLNVFIDDSSSMLSLVEAVKAAYRTMMREMKEEAGKSGACEVLVSVIFLNRGLILPYQRVEEVSEELAQYEPYNGTPLRRRGREVLGMIMTKVTEIAESGRQVQTFTVIISDGQPNGTDVAEVPASDISEIVTGMNQTKQHIICVVDIGGTCRDEFLQWGVIPKWIIDPAKDKFAFEQAMAQVSRASRSASRSAGEFGKAAQGGFR